MYYCVFFYFSRGRNDKVKNLGVCYGSKEILYKYDDISRI